MFIVLSYSDVDSWLWQAPVTPVWSVWFTTCFNISLSILALGWFHFCCIVKAFWMPTHVFSSCSFQPSSTSKMLTINQKCNHVVGWAVIVYLRLTVWCSWWWSPSHPPSRTPSQNECSPRSLWWEPGGDWSSLLASPCLQMIVTNLQQHHMWNIFSLKSCPSSNVCHILNKSYMDLKPLRTLSLITFYNNSRCMTVFPHRWGPIFCESQAWIMPSRVKAASAQKPFTSMSSQIRPTQSIHCRGVIHTKWARPKLWNKHMKETTLSLMWPGSKMLASLANRLKPVLLNYRRPTIQVKMIVRVGGATTLTYHRSFLTRWSRSTASSLSSSIDRPRDLSFIIEKFLFRLLEKYWLKPDRVESELCLYKTETTYFTILYCEKQKCGTCWALRQTA